MRNYLIDLSIKILKNGIKKDVRFEPPAIIEFKIFRGVFNG